jgi:hypothetical protein
VRRKGAQLPGNNTIEEKIRTKPKDYEKEMTKRQEEFLYLSDAESPIGPLE